MGLIEKIRAAIEPLDSEAAARAKARLDSFTKLPGSLGDLKKSSGAERQSAVMRRMPTSRPTPVRTSWCP